MPFALPGPGPAALVAWSPWHSPRPPTRRLLVTDVGLDALLTASVVIENRCPPDSVNRCSTRGAQAPALRGACRGQPSAHRSRRWSPRTGLYVLESPEGLRPMARRSRPAAAMIRSPRLGSVLARPDPRGREQLDGPLDSWSRRAHRSTRRQRRAHRRTRMVARSRTSRSISRVISSTLAATFTASPMTLKFSLRRRRRRRHDPDVRPRRPRADRPPRRAHHPAADLVAARVALVAWSW